MLAPAGIKRYQRNGFSFVEIMMVLLIIGIIAAVAVPKWHASIAGYRADLASAKLVADLKFASIKARTSSREITIEFFAAGSDEENTWLFAAVDDPQSPGQPLQVDIGDAPWEAELSVAPTSITFNIQGVPTTSGSWTVNSGTAYQRTVTIQQGTGEIEIQ